MDTNDFPHNIDIEKQVLGAMLIRDGEIIPKLLNIINADDFYRPEHRVIFKHIVQLYLNGIAPNIYSLIDDMRKAGLSNFVLEYALDSTALMLYITPLSLKKNPTSEKLFSTPAFLSTTLKKV